MAPASLGTAGRSLLFDDDDALWTGVGTAPGELFLARGHIDFFNGDIAIIIERKEFLRHCSTARIANACSFVDPYFHVVAAICTC